MGLGLQHSNELSVKRGPVVSQSDAAQGFASRTYLACLTHLSMVNSDLGPTELPASEPFQFSEYVVYEDPRLEQHTPGGDGLWFYKRFLLPTTQKS